MDALARFTDNNILVIDDVADVRTQIVNHLSLFGFHNLWSAGTCRKALSQIAGTRFDVILCDYHLGDDTSGQQFLEYLRSRNVVAPSTVFVMITAVRAYEDVMRAAECAPDDYLVKPFTGMQLSTRLAKLLQKRHRLSAVYAAMANSDWSAAVAHCDTIIATQDRFAMDAAKLKGQALLKAARPVEAQALYNSVLAVRPLGWAQLGLARALKAQNDMRAAEDLLATMIADGRKNVARDRMSAYDELADVLQNTNRNKEAISLIQDAMSVSPGSLPRTRSLTQLAVLEGDMELAEKTVRQFVVEHKHSQIKEANDYLTAADVLSSTGHADEALATIQDAKRSFISDMRDVHTLTVAEATARIAKGEIEAAAQLLHDLPRDVANTLTPAAAATLGKALYRVDDIGGADRVMRRLIQNNPDNPNVIRAVHTAMAAAGQELQSKALVDSSIEEAAERNNEGVRLAYAGKLDQAIALLTEAAELLPGNTQFVSNAALVIALALSKGQTDRKLLQTCLKYRQIVAARVPDHPKLAQVDGLLGPAPKSRPTHNQKEIRK